MDVIPIPFASRLTSLEEAVPIIRALAHDPTGLGLSVNYSIIAAINRWSSTWRWWRWWFVSWRSRWCRFWCSGLLSLLLVVGIVCHVILVSTVRGIWILTSTSIILRILGVIVSRAGCS